MNPICIYHGNLSSIDASYLAGLIDGEGCISVTRTNTSASAKGCKRGFSYRASICITMTDESLLRWACAITGLGSVCPKKTMQAHHKKAWAWQVWSREAADLGRLVFPYLRLKRVHAERLLAFQDSMRQPGSRGLSDAEWSAREAAHSEFRVLNFRGKAA